VPDQKTGVAGELVLGLGDSLFHRFLGDKFPARDDGAVYAVGLIQFTDEAACIRALADWSASRDLSCASLKSERTSS
jgi:hypothetical protein